jgi:aminoglycoside phosphotransferase (APT) family kinase protein
VETAGGLVFRIAQDADVGQRYAVEAKCLPLLKAHLPIPIPEPLYSIPETAEFPFGVIGYPKLAGIPFEPPMLTALAHARVLAQQLGAVIAALHRAPLLGLIENRRVPLERWGAQRDVVLPALREALLPEEFTVVSRWWEQFLRAARSWVYDSVLVHGDLWYGNWLVDGTNLLGVIDFENLSSGDPVTDFVPQLYLGERFLRLVIDAFRAAGGKLDSGFEERLLALWVLRDVGGVEYAVLRDDAEELADSVAKVRKGPILGAHGLDGWRQPWA